MANDIIIKDEIVQEIEYLRKRYDIWFNYMKVYYTPKMQNSLIFLEQTKTLFSDYFKKKQRLTGYKQRN